MSNERPNHRPTERAPQSTTTGRRAYEKPGFLTRQVFERQALSCSGCASTNPGAPPFGCCLRS
jgi:hypothetical protein